MVTHKRKLATSKKAVPSSKKPTVSKPYTKTEIVASLAEYAELSKKQVNLVLEGLSSVIERHVKKNSPGIFVLPGLFKIQVTQKPATKARKGKNPFTGEEMTFKAKPARRTIKIKALKSLKEMA